MKVSILLVACVLASFSSARGANRYFFENQTVPPGAVDVELFLQAETDQTTYAFSFGVNYDQTAITVKSVTWEGTSIALEPAFFDGNIESVNGLIGYGCVFDFMLPFANALPAAADLRLAKIVVDVIGAPGTSSDLVLETVPSNPAGVLPVKNVLSDELSVSHFPALVKGTLTIEDRRPVISSVSGNEGLAGTVFQATGEFLGEPGLAVKVCGAAAAAVLRGDGVTLDVTAPECGTTGFAPLEVCTVHGCDTEAQGFNYAGEDRTPVINSFSANEGSAGAVFQVTGEFFGEPGLEVKVCDAVAAAVLRGDGITLDVTAPECATAGFALLEVCTTHGCDSEPQGFNYLSGGGGLQKPSDCNQDGALNLADAICLLGHLFLGSPTTLPCEGGTVANPGNKALLDSNGDALVNLADAIGVLLFLFSGGPPPPLGTSCVGIGGCPAACQ